MKATGIIRKIDELGRLVIPKEIRKLLRIRVGDSLEIFVDNDEKIVLKKHIIMGDILKMSEDYTEILSKITGCSCIITDKEKVIAISGSLKKEYLNTEISQDVLDIMEDRLIWQSKDNNLKKIIKGDASSKYNAQLISPIISEGDVIGSCILYSKDYECKITEVEYKLIQSVSIFLGKQIEQ